MNFRITYLHNILYIKKERKGKKKLLIHTGRQFVLLAEMGIHVR